MDSPIETWARRAVLGPGVALELRMLQEKVGACQKGGRGMLRHTAVSYLVRIA